MRLRLDRVRAAARLLLTMFDNLRLRTWWAYRGAALPPRAPRVAVIAQRAPDRATYVPRVTAAWHAVAAGALPVEAATMLLGDDAPLPAAWIDAAARPDVADLPRVLRQERDPALLGTQWLADQAEDRVLLVVTVAEPVSCTWAIAFDLPRYTDTLRQIAPAEHLIVVLQPPAAIARMEELTIDNRAPHVIIPLASNVQLRAILASLPFAV